MRRGVAFRTELVHGYTVRTRRVSNYSTMSVEELNGNMNLLTFVSIEPITLPCWY